MRERGQTLLIFVWLMLLCHCDKWSDDQGCRLQNFLVLLLKFESSRQFPVLKTLLTLLNFSNRLVPLFLEPSVICFGFWDIKMRSWKFVSQQYRSLVRLHGCSSWPGSILLAKAKNFRFQQCNGSVDLSFFQFWNCPLSALVILRQHRCAGWPGSILVTAKVNHFRLQLGNIHLHNNRFDHKIVICFFVNIKIEYLVPAG